jgi:hypothetical protein
VTINASRGTVRENRRKVRVRWAEGLLFKVSGVMTRVRGLYGPDVAY